MKENGFAKDTKMKTFLTNGGEKLILVERQHGFVLILRLGTILLGTLIALTLFPLAFSYFSLSPKLPIVVSFIFLIIAINLIVKSYVDWYFHLYIVTTRKIMEASYAPLFSHVINEVLLDQVRCTEVDIQMEGIVKEIIDMGNIMVTFDRPTHQEEFCLINIKNPQKIGILLGDALDNMQHYFTGDPVWYRTKGGVSRFTEQIFPRNIMPMGGGFA